MADLFLSELSFTNFKSFNGSHTFKLGQKPGLYFIGGKNLRQPALGANGVGKSTIWDALIWVLWGRTGRDNKPGGAVQPWRGDKAVKAVLDFERQGNGGFQSIRRTRNPNHLLWCKHEPGAEWHEITQDEVPKIIGMSEEMFRRTVVLSQFGTLFLDLRAEQQAQMFTEALDLNVWLAASKRASLVANEASENLRDKEDSRNSCLAVIKNLTEQLREAETRSVVFAEEKQNRLDDFGDKIQKTQKEIKKLKAKQPPKPDSDELQSAQKLIKATLAITEDVNDEIAELRKKASDKKCSKCGQPIDDPSLQDKIAVVRANGEAQVAELTVKIEAISAKQEKYAAIREAWEEWRSQLTSAEDDLVTMVERQQEIHNESNPANKECKRIRAKRRETRAQRDKLAEEIREQEQMKGTAEFWVKGFKEIRLGIIDECLAELEVAANRHAEALGLINWRIEFQTEREAKSGNVSYGFQALLYPPKEDKPIKWESYSGGESQRWQLATAFALSEVLLSRAGVNPSMEVLDEPTKGLSPEGTSDLLALLHERAVDIGRAVYLVDHHSLDRGAFDGVVIVEKRKTGSTIKWL